MADWELHEGDALDVLPTLAAGSVDLVLADMPYGTTTCRWDTPIDFARLWPSLWHAARRGAPIVLFGSQPFTSALVMSQAKHFRYELIWDKRQAGSGFNADVMPLKTHENIVVFGKGRLTYHPQMRATGRLRDDTCGRLAKHTDEAQRANPRTQPRRYVNTEGRYYPQSILPFGNDKNRRATGHPTPKDPALLRWLVSTYSDLGATVLDFCMGCGGTGVACVETGRRFIGIEKDTAHGFCVVARRRMETTQPALPLSAD